MIVLLILSSLSGWIVTFAALLSYGTGTALSGAMLGANLLALLLAGFVLTRSRHAGIADPHPPSPSGLEPVSRSGG
jgi:hypothetical protein